MVNWKVHHRDETTSTNLDARTGSHGDVFTADFQTAGRGRLDHKWFSPPGVNLMMSAVLSSGGRSADSVATLPLVVGLAVVKGIGRCLPTSVAGIRLKWPNDVWIGGRKVAGILCELNGGLVIAGVGVNVLKADFPPEIAGRATCLAETPGFSSSIADVRKSVLAELSGAYERWLGGGFESVYGEISALDGLRGRIVSVRQTDGDASPVCGVCGGIAPDGSLLVGGVSVYAGEANVEHVS